MEKEGGRIREDEARNGMEKEREREREMASRHTPPEARDANYSGSCEQFVDYPGNVCLIATGLPRARGYLHLWRIPRHFWNR